MGSGKVLTCGRTVLAAFHRCWAARISGLFSITSRTRFVSSRRGGSASTDAATASTPTCQPPHRARPSTPLTYRIMRANCIDTPHDYDCALTNFPPRWDTTVYALRLPLQGDRVACINDCALRPRPIIPSSFMPQRPIMLPRPISARLWDLLYTPCTQALAHTLPPTVGADVRELGSRIKPAHGQARERTALSRARRRPLHRN